MGKPIPYIREITAQKHHISFCVFGSAPNERAPTVCLIIMAARYVDLAAYGQVGFPRGLLLVADEGVPH